MTHLKHLAWLALFLSAGVFADGQKVNYDILAAASGLGTGEIYSGGDPRHPRLEGARAQLNQALRLVKAGTDAASLCTPKQCRATSDAALCHVLQALSKPQQDYCRAFLGSSAEKMLELDTDERTPLVLSSVPLYTAGDKPGALRPVAAITKRGPKGAIAFHEGTIDSLSQSSLLALLTHELGHKISVGNNVSIGDEPAVGPFAHGHELLDAAGAALGLFAPEYATPAQQPPSLPETFTPEKSCPLAGDVTSQLILGMLADTEGLLPAAERISSIRARLEALARESSLESARVAVARETFASRAARGEVVSAMFRRHLLRAAEAEEIRLMAARLDGGDPYESVLASILGDNEYASAHGAASDAAGGRGGYVSAIFLDLTGRKPTTLETETTVRQLESFDRASWALAFLTKNTDAVSHLVESWYRRYLNRVPSRAESAEAMKRLAAGEGWDVARAQLMASAEYLALQQARFAGCGRKIATSETPARRTGE